MWWYSIMVKYVFKPSKPLRSFIVQAVFRSAQVKQQSITEALQSDAAEAQKLLQRQAAAEAQYDQGLQKLQATARQLRSLSSKVCCINDMTLSAAKCWIKKVHSVDAVLCRYNAVCKCLHALIRWRPQSQQLRDWLSPCVSSPARRR